MLKHFFVAAFAALAIVGPATSRAEVQEFVVDQAHSELGFTVRHIVAKVPGRFDDFSGKVWMDPNAIESTLKVEGSAKTTSIDTGIADRDKHLRTPDFFDVEKFPELTFKSKSVAKSGNNYAVTGDLTMHGVTKEVTLATEILGVSANPFTKMPTAGLELTGKVNRKDFGINWNKTLDNGGLLLSDEVNLLIRLEANVPAAAPAQK